MDKATLLNCMSEHDTTNGWDVVCCYNETKLNNLLSQKYQQGDLVSKVSFSCTYYDPLFDENVTINATLNLKEPLLKFLLGERSLCSLSMMIEGGTYVISTSEKTKTIDIPANALTVDAIVPLVGILGNTNNTYSSGEVISFSGNSVGEANIVLHFTNTTDTTFDINPVPGNEQEAQNSGLLNPQIKQEVIDNLKQFFKDNVSEIDYSMGGISNNPNSDDVLVMPQSFIFSASKPDANTDGSLNLYVQTVNSGNPQGDMTPAFQPGGKSMLPIPDGYSASLIFSYDFMTKTYLISQFKALNWGAEVSSVQQGLQLTLKSLINRDVSIPGVSTRGRDQQHSDSIKISFSDFPMILTMNNDCMALDWTFSQNVKWSEIIVDNTGYSSRDDGVIQVTVTCNKKIPMAIATGDELHFDFNLESNDFSVTTKTIRGTWPGFMSGAGAIKDDIQEKIVPAIGTFSFTLKSLNVFAVSNLLFPGKNTFCIDMKEGFHVPKDLILFGNVANSLSSSSFLTGTKTLISGASVDPKDTACFVSQVLTNNQFACSCYSMLLNESPDFTKYLSTQGYNINTAEVMPALLVYQAGNIFAWGGVYRFESPSQHAGKILKILVSSQKVFFDDNEISLSAISENSFSWISGTSTITLNFVQHLNDDGTVSPNTFTGTVVTPQGDNNPDLTESASGIQVLPEDEDEKKGWYEDGGWPDLDMICVIAGVPLVIKGYNDLCGWIEGKIENRKSVEQVKAHAEVAKRVYKNEAYTDMQKSSQETFNEFSGDLLQQFNEWSYGKVQEMSDYANYENMEYAQKKDAIANDLADAAKNFISSAIRDMKSVELGAGFDFAANGKYKKLNSVISFKEETISKVIESLAAHVNQKIADADYLNASVDFSLKDKIYHDKRTASDEAIQEYERVYADASGPLQQTQAELAQIRGEINNLTAQIQEQDDANMKAQLERELIEKEQRAQRMEADIDAEQAKINAAEENRDEAGQDARGAKDEMDDAGRERDRCTPDIAFR